MQLTKEILFPAIEELLSCIQLAHLMLGNIKIKDAILEDPKYTYLFTVEAVNQLVLSGTPFRDAYKIIGGQVAEASFSFDPNTQTIPATPHEGSIYRLCTDEIKKEMTSLINKFQ